jgi:hypothetical protein
MFFFYYLGIIMFNSARYKDFSGDKWDFLASVQTLHAAKARANEKEYKFLANNKLLIEQEFNQLFASLKKQGDNRQNLWLYCFYCCTMLQNYYSAYDKQSLVDKYRKQSIELQFRCENGVFENPAIDEDTFLRSLQKKISADLGVLASTPNHIAKIRDWLAFSNIYRIHFNFCRFTVRQSIFLMRELKWLETLSNHLDLDAMIAKVNAPAPIFNVLSVGLFAARFIINAGLLLKHTFLPSNEERTGYCLLSRPSVPEHFDELLDLPAGYNSYYVQINGNQNILYYVNRENRTITTLPVFDDKKTVFDQEMLTIEKESPLSIDDLKKITLLTGHVQQLLSTRERFFHELYARHCVMLNDLAWGSINLLTNYSAVFSISAPMAIGLTVGFLFFDVSLLIYRLHLAEQEYMLKKAQYLNEKRDYEVLLQAMTLSIEDRNKYQERCKMLDEQMSQLELSWQTTRATFWFNIAAAALLMGGFSAAFVFVAPAAIAACYFVCIIAVAMYISADIYGAYKEKSLILQQQELDGGDTTNALLAMQTARNEFIMAMVKNIAMPLLIVTVFAICWQASLIVAAVYIGYECTRGYFKAPTVNNNNGPQQLLALSNESETPIVSCT